MLLVRTKSSCHNYLGLIKDLPAGYIHIYFQRRVICIIISCICKTSLYTFNSSRVYTKKIAWVMPKLNVVLCCMRVHYAPAVAWIFRGSVSWLCPMHMSCNRGRQNDTTQNGDMADPMLMLLLLLLLKKTKNLNCFTIWNKNLAQV